MKKTLLLITVLFFITFPGVYATEPAKPARAILDYANELIIKAQEKSQEIAHEMDGERRSCLDSYGWRTVIGTRLQLGYEDFKEAVTIVKDSGCLLHDIGMIENRIMRLTRIVSESEISCVPFEAEILRNDIDKLFFLRDALEDYGNLTPEDESRARQAGAHPLQKFEDKYGAIPPQLQSVNFSLSDEIYRNDALCTEPSSFFSFHQLKREFEALIFRLNEIAQFSAEVRGVARNFSAGETPGTAFDSKLKMAEHKGRTDAESWFYENIRQPIEDGLFFEFGSTGTPLIAKDENEVIRQEMKNETRVEDSIPPPKDIKEVAKDYRKREDIHAILRMEETKHDDSVEFVKMASDSLVFISEVSTEIAKHSFEEETALLAPQTAEVRKFYEEVTRLTTEVCAQHGSCE